jgi:tetratricopeptide (TPR) repeat protein
MNNNLKVLLSVLFLAVLAFLIYSGTLNNSFMWDDRKVVLEDRYIKDLKFIPRLFSLEYTRNPLRIGQNEYRPLAKVSLAVDHSLWRNNPVGYHLTNIILHIFNTILVFFTAILLFRLYPPAEGANQNYFDLTYISAFLGALLFASHPATAETVNWVKNRAELLSIFFCLISLMLFIRHLLVSSGYLKRLYYVSSVLMFIFSFLSKESGLSLPFLLAGTLILIPGYRGIKKIIMKTALFFILALLFLSAKLTLFNSTAPSLYPDHFYPLYTRALIILKSFWQYLHILLLPLKLNAERLFLVPGSFFTKEVLTGIFSMAFVIFLFTRFSKKNRNIAFPLLWLFFAIFSVSNIIFIENRPIAEQRLYFACVPFCLFLSFSMSYFFSRQTEQVKKRLIFITVCGLALCLAYVSVTLKRNNVWKDPYTFWTETVRSAPFSPRANNNLGNALYARGDFTTAVYHHKKTIKLDPLNHKAYANLGIALAALGKNDHALALLKKAAQMFPYDPETFNNLGVAYSSAGDDKKAVRAYKKAISLNPDHARAYHNMGTLYGMNDETGKAMEYLTKAAELDPYSSGTHNNTGNLHFMNNDIEKAIEAYQKALFYHPRHYNTLINLSRVFASLGRYKESAHAFKTANRSLDIDGSNDISTEKPVFNYITEFYPYTENVTRDSDTFIVLADTFRIMDKNKMAEKFYIKALKKEPDNITAYNRLGVLYASMGEPEQSLTFFLKAMKVAPGKPESYNNAGIVLYSIGDKKSAEKMFRKALIIEPLDQIAAENLFRVLTAEGRGEEAETIIGKALRNGTVSPGMYEKYISGLMDEEKFTEILEIRDTIPDDMALSSITYNNIGIASGRTGDIDGAFSYFTKAVKADGSNVEAVYNLAITSTDKGLDDKAFTLFNKALELDNDNADILGSFAFFCFETERHKKSKELYTRLLLEYPENINIMNYLGLSYAALGNTLEAKKIFLNILDLSPDNAGICYNLGNIYFIEQEYQKAAFFFKKAIDMEPGYEKAYIKISECYLMLNDQEQSKKYYLKAKSMGITDPGLEKEINMKRGTDE